ncbi:MAG: DUF6596 domain-containing protein [Pseudolysinimonas sp.]
MSDAAAELAEVVRGQWSRIFSAVVRYTGSVELAEDSLQEALARALVARDRQVLLNPAAWVTTVAKRIAVDTVRRDVALRERFPLLVSAPLGEAIELEAPGGDDRLGMLLLACSPELAPETRVALALRFVLGAPTDAIADAMLVDHRAMSARLTRAKRRIESSGIRFELPDVADRGRLDDVLSTVSVLYTIGHTASRGSELRTERSAQVAIELARALRRAYPDDVEVAGLLGMLLLTEARTATRQDDSGTLVTLEHADRTKWNAALISEGLGLAVVGLGGGGRFGLQAGLAGLHSAAPSWESTDWNEIVRLYDALIRLWPSPAALLARAVASSFGPAGPDAALRQLDAMPQMAGAAHRQSLAVRADLLRRANRPLEAGAAYLAAMSLEHNETVRGYLTERIRTTDR